MATLKHELWSEPDGQWTFCLAGQMGNAARAALSANAQLVWTVHADSHYEAMSKYYKHQGWGEYTSAFVEDSIPYKIEWKELQERSS